VEPWNGKIRTKNSVKKKPLTGLTEEEFMAEMAPEETGERGRLFVKVMGVKDLDLPIPKSEQLSHKFLNLQSLTNIDR
jgi:hypothetical protein